MSFSARTFAKDLIERVTSTAAATLLAIVTAAGFDVIDLNAWKGALLATAVAALVSLLKGLAASKWGADDSASLVQLHEEPARVVNVLVQGKGDKPQDYSTHPAGTYLDN